MTSPATSYVIAHQATAEAIRKTMRAYTAMTYEDAARHVSRHALLAVRAASGNTAAASAAYQMGDEFATTPGPA